MQKSHAVEPQQLELFDLQAPSPTDGETDADLLADELQRLLDRLRDTSDENADSSLPDGDAAADDIPDFTDDEDDDFDDDVPDFADNDDDDFDDDIPDFTDKEADFLLAQTSQSPFAPSEPLPADEPRGFTPPDVGDLKVDIIPPLDDPEAELRRMVGCQAIRKELDARIAVTRYNTLRRRLSPGAKQHRMPLHAIFVGAPGTGKTTLCKIYASLLHKAGALSRGHVVVATRSSFMGSLWGDQEEAVGKLLRAAQGGVLMIDEAYQLNGDNSSDPARMVLPLMMPLLADESKRDIAVVLCGYREPMLKLLDQNDGLRSRFTHVVEFPDFDVDQLLEISRRRFSDYSYRLTRQARLRYADIVRDAYEQRDPKSWGNARYVANLLDHIYTAHALRCMRQGITDPRRLCTITAADITPLPMPAPQKRRQVMGFGR